VSTRNKTVAATLPETWFEVVRVGGGGNSSGGGVGAVTARAAASAYSADARIHPPSSRDHSRRVAAVADGVAAALDMLVVNWAGSSPFAPPPSSAADTVTRVSSMTVRDSVTGCDVPVALLLTPAVTTAAGAAWNDSGDSDCDSYVSAMWNMSAAAYADTAAIIVWTEVMPVAASASASATGVMRTVASASRMACRYWSEAEAAWSSSGVTLLGFRNVSGRVFLGCVSLHLTAFAGMQLSGRVSVAVNAPDVGLQGNSITVSWMHALDHSYS
jgi:hypothetical protein